MNDGDLDDLDLDEVFDLDELDLDDQHNDNTLGGTATGYGDVAQAYWTQGWRRVLPLPRGKKFPPPKGWTGAGVPEPSYADIQAWAEDHPGGNVAVAMPEVVVGIDVDHHGAKRGGDTLATAEKDWGALPPTVRSTSRTDGKSGILLYLVPPGTPPLVGQLVMDGRSDVEIVQQHHRYVVAYPSTHPTTGEMYRWLDEDNNEVGIPSVDDLPMLPDRWIKELTAPATPLVTGGGVDVRAVLADLPGGSMDSVVSARLDRAQCDLHTPGTGSRHDTTLGHVLALLRFGERKHPGVREALVALGEAFIAETTEDGSRSVADATAEYQRMISNKRGHQLISATPTVDLSMDLDDLDEVWESIDDEDSAEGVAAATSPVSPPPGPPPAGPVAPDGPPDDDEFWNSRESLRHIFDTALSRYTAPWAVAGECLTRAVDNIPHTVTLPALIGGAGSPNLFLAKVGRSGDGKGTAAAVARMLVPHTPDIRSVEVGSGEGLARQYVRSASPKERREGNCDEHGMVWLSRAVAFQCAEVDTLAALGARNSSTLLPRLRGAWSGEPLGFAYVDQEKALVVGAHSYRMSLVAGVQPARAGVLLADADGGTPQRFVWVRTTDRRIQRRPGRPPAITPLALPTDWPTDPWTMPVPDVAADTVINSHVARQRGEGDALDGHALFCRLKVLAALAVLDGRIEANEEDWQLAGHVMAHSDWVRQRVVQELAQAQQEEATERGQLVGLERDAAAGAAYLVQIERVCGVIVRGLERLAAKGRPEVPDSAITRLIAGRDRQMKGDALDALLLRRVVLLNRDSGKYSLAAVKGGGASAG